MLLQESASRQLTLFILKNLFYKWKNTKDFCCYFQLHLFTHNAKIHDITLTYHKSLVITFLTISLIVLFHVCLIYPHDCTNIQC